MIGAPNKEKKDLKPSVDSFKIGGTLKTTLKDVAKKLATISFLEVAAESSAVNSAYVESRDINGKPYLFSLMKIKKDEIGVVYSIPKTMAPRKRRIDVIRQLLNILNVINDSYDVDSKTIYNLLEKAIKDVGELVDKKTASMYVEYDTMKNENKILNKKVRLIESELEEIKSSGYETREKSKIMEMKLKEYETPSDETLKVKAIEWIKSHDGRISIPDFVSVYLGENKMGEARVEKILNELVTEGYLSAK